MAQQMNIRNQQIGQDVKGAAIVFLFFFFFFFVGGGVGWVDNTAEI